MPERSLQRENGRGHLTWGKNTTAGRSARFFSRDPTVFLLAISILVYLATRFIGLDRYPIYFFSDEAAQTILAAHLIRDGFHAGGEFLPTFFWNGYQYNLGTSVYLQILPYLLLGKSILVTRGTCVLLSVIAAVAVGLVLKNVFQSRFPWTAILFLSITPAWFLHSRTAFETAVATTFYAGFLYAYLVYRTRAPGAIFPAVLFGALAFYSYSPARVVMLLNAVFFFISDIRFHWKNRRTVLQALALAILLSLPFFRFQAFHPLENQRHLEVLNSYWIQGASLLEKLEFYIVQYANGLNPVYWFSHQTGDIPRHVMKGYGHLLQASLPFALLGLVQALRRIRQAPYRAILLSALAAPAGGALVEIGITRVLIMVIPAAVLSGMGLSMALEWLNAGASRARALTAFPVFLLMTGFNFWMTRDALVNGPFWATDYGLGGMQWGASEVFGEIKNQLKDHPDLQISLSPSWANGTDTIAEFFFEGDLPFKMESIEGYFDRKQPLDASRLFIMIPEEYHMVIESPKFTHIQVEKIIDTPDGQPGFYFVRLEYSTEMDAILAQESAQRKALQTQDVTINNFAATVRFSSLDMGPVENIFDGDPGSVIRTFEANPLKLEINLNEPQSIHGIRARIGGAATTFTYQLIDDRGKVILGGETSLGDAPDPRWLEVDFGMSARCSRILLEIGNTHDKEPAHVHLWELALK